MKISRFPAPLAFLALIGGCTPMQWQHPQFGTSRSSLDASDCDRSARIEAWHRQNMAMMMAPPFIRGRDGRLYHNRPDYPDTFFYERQLADYCMRVKGYNLVPIPGSG